ncbi:hypothetical protein ACQP0C_17535 [Nocardia sp. CA-129566]|uniref:hypothetical protein n=1 Tax=Nocardia sp. CA-129566 TaxID=3239976 RepID=UPI003D99B7D2
MTSNRFRPPATLAKIAATIDIVSGGRRLRNRYRHDPAIRWPAASTRHTVCPSTRPPVP